MASTSINGYQIHSQQQEPKTPKAESWNVSGKRLPFRFFPCSASFEFRVLQLSWKTDDCATLPRKGCQKTRSRGDPEPLLPLKILPTTPSTSECGPTLGTKPTEINCRVIDCCPINSLTQFCKSACPIFIVMVWTAVVALSHPFFPMTSKKKEVNSCWS